MSDSLQSGAGLSTVKYKEVQNQLEDSKLVIGLITKQKLRQLLDKGDVSEQQVAKFYTAARCFLIDATQYLIKWCPENELTTHATRMDFEHRLQKLFASVEYFVHRYPHLLSGINIDMLSEQFSDYQLLPDDEIPDSVKEDAGVEKERPHRVDVLWGYLRTVKKPGTNAPAFDLLFEVVQLVMTIPHSNTGEECIFSLINKNIPSSRSSLQLDNTLSSLIIVKTRIHDPLNWQPTTALIQRAKKAKKEYNSHHKN